MVAVNGIYRLTVQGTVWGQTHVHTLHFRSTIDPDALSASETVFQQELLDKWQSDARTAYRAMFTTTQSPCIQYAVRKVCGALPLPAGPDEAEVAGNILGTKTEVGEPLAPWLARNITWRTGFSGRSYRGRNYFGGMTESDVTGETVSAAMVTLTAAYCTALMNAFVTPDDLTIPARLFVYSRTLAEGKPDATPPVPPVACQLAGADVTTFQTRNVLATMKSRKAGSGT